MTDARPVLVAGGGIGGLTAAIALAQRGIAVRVFEARASFPEQGAGIQLGPNAVRLLERLGAAAPLAEARVVPDAILVHDGASGNRLARLPLGNWIETRHAAPYWVVHRRDLQSALIAVARTLPEISLETGVEVTGGADNGRHVTAMFADGRTADGCVMIGADGLWSRTRTLLNSRAQLTYSGMSAARTVIARDELASPFSDNATGVWLAPDTHVVHYPVSGGDAVAIVAIRRAAEPVQGWSQDVPARDVQRAFAHLTPSLTSFLAKGENWRQWALYQAHGIDRWAGGRLGLIGDAAHPILPFLAQGGAMAIEDAVVLADCLATGRDAPEKALALFAQKRRDRVAKVQAASLANGRAYHLRGAMALARNMTLRSVPGAMLMQRYDWIYGWDG